MNERYQMKENILKKLFIIILTLVITFLCFNFIMNKSFVIGGFKKGHSTSFDTKSLENYATDFTLQEDGSYYSESADPWFSINLDYDVKTIVLDVESISGTCNAQIFYYNDEEGVTQEHSKWVSLDNGTYYVQIPKGNYNLFRLDLTEQEGTSFKINSISFYNHRCLPTTFWVLYVVFLGCLHGLYRLFKTFKSLKEKIGEYKFYKYVLILTIVISCIIVYGALIYSGHQYVYYDIGGGDEPESYIPLFSSYIQKLQNHTLSEWTWNNGLGTSMSGFWGYMANPCTFLVIITGVLFGMSSINTMVLVAQLLNILAVGLLCYKYLSYFDGKNHSKAIASYIVAFSGYMILYAQHYVHAEFGIYIFITLILVEDILKHEKFCWGNVWLAIDCAFMFVCTVYLAYMIAIFTGVYTIFRLVQKYDKSQMKEASIKLGQIFAAAFTGFLVSLPFILVVVNELLFNSDRVSSENGLLSSVLNLLTVQYHKETLITIVLRFLSSNLQGAGNDFWGLTDSYSVDYYSAPELFFSVFDFIFMAVYYATLNSRYKDKKQRIVRVIVGLLVAFVVFNRLGSAIFNAFVAPFGRYTYLLLPLFAIVTVVSVDELAERTKRVRKSYIIVSVFTIVVLLAELFFVLNNNKPSYIVTLIVADVILVFVLLLICAINSKKMKKMSVGAFSALIFVNVTLESYITVNNRIFCSFSKDITDQDDYDTQDALAYIQQSDDSMYRVEKNYYDIIFYNDAYLQNYRGVSTYNSTLNANIKEFYRLYCNPAINYYGADSFWYSYMNVTNDIVQSSVLGVQYILSNSTSYDDSLFEKVYSNESVSVYKNKAINSFGVFYENAISKSEVVDRGYASRVGVLSSAVVLEDGDATNASNVIDYSYIKNLLYEKEISYNLISSNANEMEITFDEVESNDVAEYLEFTTDLTYADHILVYFDTGSGYEALTPYYYRGNDEKNQEARITLPAGTKKIKLESSVENYKVTNMRVITTNQPYVPNDASISIDATTDSHLEGTIHNNTDGYLLLPIPYEKGWTITVDGNEVDILKADSGFMAVYLKEGNHNIDIQYQFPGEKCGIIFAALGTFIVFLECIYLCTRKNKNKVLR